LEGRRRGDGKSFEVWGRLCPFSARELKMSSDKMEKKDPGSIK